MGQIEGRPDVATPGAAFRESYAEAGGFRIRRMEAGHGLPLVYLHGAGALRLSRAHDLLAERFRVIALKVLGFGRSRENTTSESAPALARTMAEAVAAIGLGRYNLLGWSFGGRLAAWMAVQFPERIEALMLAAPTAILPEGHVLPDAAGAPPEQWSGLLYAHSERQAPTQRADPAVAAKQAALVRRLPGPNRDPELEGLLGALDVPTLVLFGTEDRLIPPEMGRMYRAIMPNCHFVLVYDAGHAIDADRPETFARVVGDFLERREQFIVTRTSGLIDP